MAFTKKQINTAWNNAKKIRGKDPAKIRQDPYGNEMHIDSYGKTSAKGWESYCQIWCLRVVGHAAIWSGFVVSIPSLNVTPVMTFAR